MAALFADFEFGSEQGLRCGRAETNDDVRLYQTDFGFQPGTAGSDLARIGFFVNAAFTAWFPFEMLDDIGDVSFAAIDAGFL